MSEAPRFLQPLADCVAFPAKGHFLHGLQGCEPDLCGLQIFTGLRHPGTKILDGVAALAYFFLYLIQAAEKCLKPVIRLADTCIQVLRFIGPAALDALIQAVFETLISILELLQVEFKILHAESFQSPQACIGPAILGL